MNERIDRGRDLRPMRTAAALIVAATIIAIALAGILAGADAGAGVRLIAPFAVYLAAALAFRGASR